MKLEIACLSLGPVGTNCYIVVDAATREAIVVDPGWDAHLIIDHAEKMKAKVRAVWLTHSHFDHIGGVAGLVLTLNIPVALHSKELPLYKMRGGAILFGLDIDEPPEPTIIGRLCCRGEASSPLQIGSLKFEVRVPGHTQGHVAFYQRLTV